MNNSRRFKASKFHRPANGSEIGGMTGRAALRLTAHPAKRKKVADGKTLKNPSGHTADHLL
jgi:hypothetical protein